MAFGARILANSVTTWGQRLVTFEVTHPRYILAEVNTHRMLSKNSASSRAIPVATMIARLRDDPYTPVYWGSNKKGMQAGEELDEAVQKICLQRWLRARDEAIEHAAFLRVQGVHKQDANRLLEPFMWHTAIITATEWDNFFHLRNHPDAHPAFQTVAGMMQELYEELEPVELGAGSWHLPLIDDDVEKKLCPSCLRPPNPITGTLDPVWCGQPECDPRRHSNLPNQLLKISTGRCARVSYLTHDGKRDLQADIGMHNDLGGNGHMSPFEHQARPATEEDRDLCMMRWSDVNQASTGVWRLHPKPSDMWFGNFRGWVQYRKTIAGESDMLGYLVE